jgi:serine protease Do
MRAGKVAGVAVLGVAALVALWQVPALVAAGQQSGSQNQQAGKQKVEKQAGAEPKIVVRGLTGGPSWTAAALAGGGPRLGVQIRDVGKEDVARLKLTARNGVVIDEVMNNSAAQKAGVKAGDVVVQFDGESVRSAQQFTRLVRETAADRTVKMAVIRDGKRMDLDVTPSAADDEVSVFVGDEIRGDVEREMKDLQGRIQQYRFERPAPAPMPERAPMPPGGTPQWRQERPLPLPRGDALQWFGDDATGNFVFSLGRGRLGVTVQELTPELAAYFGVKDGLLVSAVQADSPAAKAGIKAGDVIGSVDGKAVAASDELIRELGGKDGEVTIGLTRDKKLLSLKATLEARKLPARRVIASGRPA